MMDFLSPLGRVLIPVTLVVLTLFVGTLQQTVAVLAARSDLMAVLVRQEQPFGRAINFRNQLGSLATDTVKLASEGDPAAKAIIDSLRKQGIALPEAK